MLSNTTTRYGVVSKIIHWVIGLSIIGLIWLGWWMVGLDYYDTWYHTAPAWHKAVGMAVLFLAVAKLVWHRLSPPPELQTDLKVWEQRAAGVVHMVLISSMFVLPLTGYLVTTSSGQPVSFFGWFDVPALVGKNEAVRDLSIVVHAYLSYALVGVVCLHAGAALKHQLIDGHGTLKRIL